MRSDLILRFWRRADGAVSIYLIVSTAAMLLLTSMLIDLARIAAFDRQAELAGQSGIRSALSAYDDRLYERYGLFGTGGSDRGVLFAHAVQHNWTAEGADSFRLLDMKSEASHVDSYEVLGNHAVFKRQVLEEMKYKAPIDFTLEIASKFAPIAGAMKEASTSVELLGEVRKLYEERERRLDEVLALQKKAAAAASERLPSLLGATAPSIVDDYGDYLRWQSEEAALEEGEEPAHRDEIDAYRERAMKAADSISESANQALNSHSENEQLAQAALREAKQLNASIRAAADRYRTAEGSSNYDRIGRKEIAESESASIVLNELGQTRGAVSELVLDDSWFDDYANALSEQTNALQKVNDRAVAFRASVRSALGGQGSSSTSLKLVLQSLQNAYQDYKDSYGPSGNVIQSREAERGKRQASDRERKENEATASSKLGEVKRLIEQMKSAPIQEENRKAFQQMKQRLEANLQFNHAAQTEDETSEPLGGQSGETVLHSMNAVGTIFGGMADLLEDIRDPLYINEYIAHRFQAFDPKQFKQLADGGQQGSLSNALSLENQEVEYILYGIHDPVSDIAAAYGELFALRLAVRTMEGFIECRTLGHPLLVLSAAVVYGIEKAMADMATLCQKGTIQFSKYAPAELSYLDYLRLFLILHGSSDGRIARIIAVIEQNTDTVLSRVSTGLTGELTASVNLWFLPGLMRSFAVTGILSGKVRGNRYETTRTIGWSYG